MRSRIAWTPLLRLSSGLTMYTFVCTHLLNHSLGLISLDAQEAGRVVFLSVWRSLPGATLLITAASLHLTLVMGYLIRRRTLRMPLWESVRLTLGLTTLFFVIFHGLETYGMNLRHGLQDTYFYVLLYIWPDAWWRQTILIAAAWTHGCMGVHFWLRVRPWYRRWMPVLYSAALLLPVLAWLGAWNGSAEAKARAAAQAKPAYSSSASSGYGSSSDYGSAYSSGSGSDYGSSGTSGASGGSGYGSEYGSGSESATSKESGAGSDYSYGSDYGAGKESGSSSDYGYGSSYGSGSDYGYGSSYGTGKKPAGEGKVISHVFGYDESGGIALLSREGLADRHGVQMIGLALCALFVGGVFSLRAGVQAWRRRKGLVRFAYPDGRQVTAPRGTSVLEASRMAGIPHAAVCGGRGRCTTCRVRVEAGAEQLPPPNELEAPALARIGNPPRVRLACQIRPTAPLSVTPLVPPTQGPALSLDPESFEFGAEREIAVMFCDLRGFTTLSHTKLPFDVVYLLNQYAQSMGPAIEAEGGHLDKFIGDGIMALFGVHSAPRQACREALAAARAMGERLESLNRHLATDLAEPLRIGIGIHAGPAIIGRMGYRHTAVLTAIGDTVNLASRLESATKEHHVQLILSAAVARYAELPLPGVPRQAIPIRGAAAPVEVLLVAEARQLPDPHAGSGAAAAPAEAGAGLH